MRNDGKTARGSAAKTAASDVHGPRLHEMNPGEREVMTSSLKARGSAVNLGMKALTGGQRERQIGIATVRTLMKLDPQEAKTEAVRKLLEG